MKCISLTASVIVPALAALVVGCDAPEQAPSRKNSSSAPAWSENTRVATTPPAAQLTPADFLVEVIVTEQKCFGSAGCNYRYTIDPRYISDKPLPEKTTVIFTVTGGDQDQVGNFTIDAEGTARFDRETSISGAEHANLQATVTRVVVGR
ncbi:Uncharacterised protein [Mycolicibacterium phlei]|jgi:hypothetical protein|uniref:Lipoprotein n=1 Tax=Mycolicibacterium phlei DSM 43239 = CCUG 21000 TaxID=1226750 RepID=A0A5N5V4P2_MYCPH|nr:hypothetical protein [Mycolicibacterium phlei]KAB7756891.1 hypothetical protein MPHL21000_09790 [Mycolicibacterium phlei DSM 43239 = CCUG 21000]KXW63912.1 hypothetical protein MPHL43070_23155 [Mycolicibacterium phlei DSM 43070]KXW69304.1 hypothetical protein MPHL43072_20980 [Mycolicibacterium phlei DSM 43072]KXW76255.1 hypothetical protein JL15_17960 [Mycolicibacterium phlei DSM 43071]VEG08939.1 Uncharacterised protein [Mycobacteroides chelonae]